MDFESLKFFDNEGLPILFTDKDGVLEADIYLEPVSVSLYDNFNIYVLEEYDDSDGNVSHRFPVLDKTERYLFRWGAEDNEIPEFFMYDIKKSSVDNRYYIDKPSPQEEYLFEYVDRNIRSPYQVNVGFSPTEELPYQKSLLVIREVLDGDAITQELKFKINFYSEGIEEDERFRIQMENFGIRLNKTDALAIKDYNVSEAYPDWEIVNNIRKHLVLEKEELVPYLGTYRCLKNIISLFGYGDSIDVREYYKNINPNSEYFGKYSIVSIADYLDNGKVDSMNLVSRNVNVRNNGDFQKCGMLALAYEFNKKTGEYDENGIPLLEKNSEFSTNEMFFKLHKMKDILERDYLPVNVFICDVIGEWSYYISFSRYVWTDKLEIVTMHVGNEISINMFPEVNHHIFDVSMLHTKRYDGIGEKDNSEVPYNYMKHEENLDNTIDVPNKYVNDIAIPPYVNEDDVISHNFYGDRLKIFSEQTGIPQDGRLLKEDDIDSLCDAIRNFYSEYQSSGFDEIYKKTYSYVDSGLNPMGFPVILSVDLHPLKVEELSRTTFLQLAMKDESYGKKPFENTWNDIIFQNYVDIEWHIEYNTPVDRKNDRYIFDYSGSVRKSYMIPQLLPYTGSYDVSVKVRDIYGIVSYSYNDSFIVVDDGNPQIVATYPGDDIFDFSIDNLKYVTFEDFGASTFENPRVNILDNVTDSDVILDPNVISSSEIYSWFKDTEVYNYTVGRWERLEKSGDQNADNFGFGDYKALRFMDFKGARFSDIFHVRPTDCVLSSDKLMGFWFMVNSNDARIYYKFHKDGTREYYDIPKSETAEDICRIMNSHDNGKLPYELRNFTYYPVNVPKSDAGIYGIKDNEWTEDTYIIMAEARDFSRYCAMRLEYEGCVGSEFTFDIPDSGLDRSIAIFRNKKLNPEYLGTAIDFIDVCEKPNEVYTDEYLMEHGFICTDNALNDAKKRGYIPMLYDTNLINQNTCKVHTHSFCIPLYKRVIFFVNNIVGKNPESFEWTLKDIYGNIVLKVRKNPYFIYNFNEIGNYELDVALKDNNNNQYSTNMVKFINVLGREDYLEQVRYKLEHKDK